MLWDHEVKPGVIKFYGDTLRMEEIGDDDGEAGTIETCKKAQ